MKICIWCFYNETETDFNKIAHTIPQSIGGQMTCENICDDCNHYFGSIHDKLPSIEETVKEAFNITRARLLGEENYGSNKALPRFKSKYFNVNIKERKIVLKPAFQLKGDFQFKLAHQFKRGIYKIFLEEIERQTGDGSSNKYDFIRDFARHNEGTLPLFYYEKTVGIIMSPEEWIKNPLLFIDKDNRFKYLYKNDEFLEFELLGHVFGIVTSCDWKIKYDSYLIDSARIKKKMFIGMRAVTFLTDIDLTLNKFNE